MILLLVSVMNSGLVLVYGLFLSVLIAGAGKAGGSAPWWSPCAPGFCWFRL